jgi:hypothetical protein
MVWDQSSETENSQTGQVQCFYTAPASDPFDNLPMVFSYNFTITGRTHLAFSPTYVTTPIQGIPGTCDPPNICVLDTFQEAGPHTLSWAGADSTGALRTDIKGFSLCSSTFARPKNVVVVYGTAPLISGALVTVNPPLYQPERGNQSVNFSLSTYQNQPVNVSVTYVNQTSLSTLRTITATGVSSGNVSLLWDGRADNGMWVAPGNYTVTVTVTDTLGNKAWAQILTKVRY